METIEVNDTGASNIDAACNEAVSALGDKVASPVMISWFDNRDNTFAPDTPGGNPRDRWHDYGVSFGATHEEVVGERFRIMVSDAGGFTQPDVKFVNMTDKAGRRYLCIDASCSADSRRPLDQTFAAGGGKGGA